MPSDYWPWIAFNLFVLLMLALDLGVFNRKSHVITVKESMAWTLVWIVLALIFNLGIGHFMGNDKALEFLTGYVIEKSLSVDNIFVIALLFSYFSVPPQHQHKVLFWGILGALAMRATMIAVGAKLITEFSWIIYIFGGFLIVTGLKMLLKRETEIHPEQTLVVRLFRRLLPVTPGYHEGRFFIRQQGALMATPLFVALLVVEFTDLIFAVDSIPAIFAVTTDPFIVYTSNVFAILGLRSLYFALAGILDKFHYLKVGLGLVLIFVGIKMLLGHTPWRIDTHVSLGVIVLLLAGSVIASILWPIQHDPSQPKADDSRPPP